MEENPEDPKNFEEAYKLWLGEWIAAIRYTYYSGLGNFENSEADEYGFFSWLIFFLATIFNIVILFNLLIAIVNDIFNRVISQKYEN